MERLRLLVRREILDDPLERIPQHRVSREFPYECERRSRSEAGGGVKVKHLLRQYPQVAGGIQVLSWDCGVVPLHPPRGEASFSSF